MRSLSAIVPIQLFALYALLSGSLAGPFVFSARADAPVAGHDAPSSARSEDARSVTTPTQPATVFGRAASRDELDHRLDALRAKHWGYGALTLAGVSVLGGAVTYAAVRTCAANAPDVESGDFGCFIIGLPVGGTVTMLAGTLASAAVVRAVGRRHGVDASYAATLFGGYGGMVLGGLVGSIPFFANNNDAAIRIGTATSTLGAISGFALGAVLANHKNARTRFDASAVSVTPQLSLTEEGAIVQLSARF